MDGTHRIAAPTQVGRASDSTTGTDAEPGTATSSGLPFVRRADRAKAYKAAQRHTLLVRALRVVLPVCAVGTVGLYALNAQISVNLGKAKGTVERVELSTDNLRMVTPRLEGVTDDNGRYVVSAKSGTQEFDSPDIINLEEVDARVARPNDEWVHLVADTGRFETKTDKMELNGNIRIVADNGMDAQLHSARIDIKGNRVVSTDPVRIDMPNGQIDSQSVLIDTGAKTISFVGDVRVKLFKRPQQASVAGQ